MWFIFYSSPWTFCLYSIIIPIHLYSKKSRFTPIGSPTISTNPIFDSIFFSPSNNCYLMINFWRNYRFCKDSSIILKKFMSYLKPTRNRSSCINLSFHIINSRNRSILNNFPDWITTWRPTIICSICSFI